MQRHRGKRPFETQVAGWGEDSAEKIGQRDVVGDANNLAFHCTEQSVEAFFQYFIMKGFQTYRKAKRILH